MMKPFTLFVTAMVVLGMLSADARAAEQVSTRFPMPVRLQASVDASGCENSPGPQITLNGALTLGGLGADLIFRNNDKGTHTATVESDAKVVVLPAGQSLSIPKQPVLGGVGGNPFIWIQLIDGAGTGLTAPIFLGRCVQGISGVQADFTLPSSAMVEFAADGCYNNPGPTITLSGEIALTGINARFYFSNNDNSVGGPHQATDTTSVDLVVVPAGTSVQIPKQPVLGGVGGNPWISVLFSTGSGDPIGSEFALGRCVQLSK